MEYLNIAVLLTCFNRKELTLTCLKSLYQSLNVYNSKKDKIIKISIFLTDDACTDGTADAVRACLEGEDLHIIKADGNAFWAGGMRMAWREAIKIGGYDFYLLLNDDTEVWNNLFDEMLSANDYCIKEFGKEGVYSGNTTWKKDHSKITFGGKKGDRALFERYYRLNPNGTPQRCDIVNANILMVSNSVVKQIGIFLDCYKHGAADNDYGLRANKAGIPVAITGDFCGSCDADNYNHQEECIKVKNMTLSQRAKYFANPVHSVHDQYEFARRWRKTMVPMILFSHMLLRYMPKLYSRLLRVIAN